MHSFKNTQKVQSKSNSKIAYDKHIINAFLKRARRCNVSPWKMKSSL